jgi:hypothetical protein
MHAAHNYLVEHRYEPILYQLKPSEGLFLRELASRAETPQDRADVAAAALARGAEMVGVVEMRFAADHLVTKSIISVHAGGRVGFAVPGLRDYMIEIGWMDPT